MRNKKEVLDAINKLVLAEVGGAYPDIVKLWEDQEFQRKLGNTIGLKNKDLTNGIKRNKSSYLFFCQDIRPSIVAEIPYIKPNEVMVRLGQLWSTIKPNDRLKYEVMAEDDRRRYISLKESHKKLNRPVKISAYLQFCADERPVLKKKHPELSTKDITSKLGSIWNDYKKNDPQYLKSRYDFSSPPQDNGSKCVLTPSIPMNICSKNVKAIQELINSK